MKFSNYELSIISQALTCMNSDLAFSRIYSDDIISIQTRIFEYFDLIRNKKYGGKI